MRSRGSAGRCSALRRGSNRSTQRPPATRPPPTSPNSHANDWSRLLRPDESVDWFKHQSQPTDAPARQCCVHRSKRLSRNRRPRLGPQENRWLQRICIARCTPRRWLGKSYRLLRQRFEHTHHPDSHGIHRQHAILSLCCPRGGFAETDHHNQSRTNGRSRARLRLALHLHRQ